MKKKLFSLMAVSAALTTAGCALVACGGGDNGGSAKTDVTKAQWVAAFKVDSFASNFKLSAISTGKDNTESQEMSIVVGPKKYGDYSMTYVRFLNGVKEREQNTIRIFGAEGDTLYRRSSRLDKDENKFVVGDWYYQNDEHEEYTDAVWQSHVLDEIGFSYVTSFAESYDSFSYSNGAYVLAGDGLVLDEDSGGDDFYSYSYKMTAIKATIKFSNNKLVSVEMTLQNEHESKYDDEEPVSSTEEINTVVTITYGGQKVTAPEGAIKYEEENE